MEHRILGQGLAVSQQGLGCMGMSEFYGVGDEAESIAVINAALDAGVNFLDTADMYGPFTNERLVGRAIATRRDEVVLATKFGNQRSEDGQFRVLRHECGEFHGNNHAVRLVGQGFWVRVDGPVIRTRFAVT